MLQTLKTLVYGLSTKVETIWTFIYALQIAGIIFARLLWFTFNRVVLL